MRHFILTKWIPLAYTTLIRVGWTERFELKFQKMKNGILNRQKCFIIPAEERILLSGDFSSRGSLIRGGAGRRSPHAAYGRIPLFLRRDCKQAWQTGINLGVPTHGEAGRTRVISFRRMARKYRGVKIFYNWLFRGITFVKTGLVDFNYAGSGAQLPPGEFHVDRVSKVSTRAAGACGNSERNSENNLFRLSTAKVFLAPDRRPKYDLPADWVTGVTGA